MTNYEHILRETINWFNGTYKTDFEFSEFVRDEMNFAVVYYSQASDIDVFLFGRDFGRMCEAYDKKLANSLPPGYFNNLKL